MLGIKLRQGQAIAALATSIDLISVHDGCMTSCSILFQRFQQQGNSAALFNYWFPTGINGSDLHANTGQANGSHCWI